MKKYFETFILKENPSFMCEFICSLAIYYHNILKKHNHHSYYLNNVTSTKIYSTGCMAISKSCGNPYMNYESPWADSRFLYISDDNWTFICNYRHPTVKEMHNSIMDMHGWKWIRFLGDPCLNSGDIKSIEWQWAQNRRPLAASWAAHMQSQRVRDQKTIYYNMIDRILHFH